jgi:hypothetical protein
MFTVITTVTVREIIPKWLNIGEISKFTQMLSDTKNIYVMLLWYYLIIMYQQQFDISSSI